MKFSMDKEKIIDIFKSTEALLEGHFVLTSGRHSAAYFQCAKVLQFPENLGAILQFEENSETEKTICGKS